MTAYRGEVLIGPHGSPRSGWWSLRFETEDDAARWVARQQAVDRLCHSGRVVPAGPPPEPGNGESTLLLPLFDEHPDWGVR